MLKFVDNIFLSDTLKSAIGTAQAIARENRNPEYTPAHLLKGLLHVDVGLIPVLTGLQKDIRFLKDWADAKIKTCVKVPSLPAIAGDEFITNVMYEANRIRLQLLNDTIAPIYALAALSTPGIGFTNDLMEAFPLRRDELMFLVAENDIPVAENNWIETVSSKDI